jgi:hypothetical protein
MNVCMYYIYNLNNFIYFSCIIYYCINKLYMYLEKGILKGLDVKYIEVIFHWSVQQIILYWDKYNKSLLYYFFSVWGQGNGGIKPRPHTC